MFWRVTGGETLEEGPAMEVTEWRRVVDDDKKGDWEEERERWRFRSWKERMRKVLRLPLPPTNFRIAIVQSPNLYIMGWLMASNDMHESGSVLFSELASKPTQILLLLACCPRLCLLHVLARKPAAHGISKIKLRLHLALSVYRPQPISLSSLWCIYFLFHPSFFSFLLPYYYPHSHVLSYVFALGLY